jgi:polysaccharide pyruvyl transferase WcaK-like protein
VADSGYDMHPYAMSIDRPAPRIFMDPGTYNWRNSGDVLMFEVALTRLRSFWPDAHLTVHTLVPELLLELDPLSLPLDPFGSWAWNGDAALLGRSLDVMRALRRRLPRVMSKLAETALRLKRREPGLARDYRNAIRQSDLVLLSGAGSLNDEFRLHAFEQLETLELAIESGATTALMGHGIGPMSDAPLRDRAAAILPRVDLITLREGLASSALLQAIGVSPDRVAVTGDEAITTAYDARPDALGSALGINLRVAKYSGVGAELQSVVAKVVRDVAKSRRAELVAVPIFRAAETDDFETAKNMIAGLNPVPPVATTADLLDVLARCRMVVAGSYHAAVLALSMGIPAVTIAKSQYYIDKFRGLAAQFGAGCRVELATARDFSCRLRSAIDETWRDADLSRAGLLQAAEHQILLGEHAYRRLFQLVEARRRRSEPPAYT